MAILRGLVDLLFPPACQVCRTPDPAVLCAACRERFRLIQPPVCDRCGRPLRGPPGLDFSCIPCRGRRLHFRRARAVGVYEGSLREAIHALKFGGRIALSEPLGLLMAQVAVSDPALACADLVVPVPLHPTRLAERGFNQAELLGREVAAALGKPLAPQALARVRATAAQSRLEAAERRRNVRLAFAAGQVSSARSMLLVDDVFSTGCTASDCARALRAAGAREVVVLTLAHSVLE